MRASRIAAGLFLLLAGPAAACPVCFGKSLDHSGFAQGLTLGILVLLGFTFSILGVLTATVLRIERARLAAEARGQAVAR